MTGPGEHRRRSAWMLAILVAALVAANLAAWAYHARQDVNFRCAAAAAVAHAGHEGHAGLARLRTEFGC